MLKTADRRIEGYFKQSLEQRLMSFGRCNQWKIDSMVILIPKTLEKNHLSTIYWKSHNQAAIS